MDNVEVVNKIIDLRDKGFTREIDGLTYAVPGLKPVFFEPHPETLKVNTLTGLVDYIKSNLDELGDHKKYALHICDYAEVQFISRVKGKQLERDLPILARVDECLKEYNFGTFYDLETFNIALRTQFLPTDDQARILEYTSRVTDKTEITQSEDGVTQLVSVAKGLAGATLENVTLPKTVSLKPFRTFREIEQVESLFIFRMKKGTTGVMCALFEADGGAWRHDTMKRIQGYLLEALPEIMTIA